MLVTDAAPPASILVAFLILLNVVLGSRQELKARASVDALSNLRAGVLTTSLTGLQWLECVGLALLLPFVIEVSKAVRHRIAAAVAALAAPRAVNPERALGSGSTTVASVAHR